MLALLATNELDSSESLGECLGAVCPNLCAV